MADILGVQVGTPPWQPNPRAELVETYHYHDQPLVGLLRQDGVEFIFQCLAGEIEPVSLWAYTLIQPDELERLEAAGPEEFDAVLNEVTFHRSVVVAGVGPQGIMAAVSGMGLEDIASLMDELTQTVLRMHDLHQPAEA